MKIKEKKKKLNYIMYNIIAQIKQFQTSKWFKGKMSEQE